MEDDKSTAKQRFCSYLSILKAVVMYELLNSKWLVKCNV
ncbi:hypothetical protein UYSO10_1578 [Kosakonia radicincitans]|nr:hypothetical protein UYSO10_1578 [Kosakonia radicincitans]